MTKIYTKTGDDGSTGLIGNKRVSKSNPRIIAYGTVDEINSALGVVLSLNPDKDIRDLLVKIQNDLFVLGADLANSDLKNTSNRITQDMVHFLEEQIDRLEKELSSITYFILPGGDPVASQVHLARAISRRAETCIVSLSEKEQVNKIGQIYINRLSDLLFVIARVINKRKMIKDTAWQKLNRHTLIPHKLDISMCHRSSARESTRLKTELSRVQVPPVAPICFNNEQKNGI